MKNQTFRFNSAMMIELQNHYAYSEYALQLHRWMKKCTLDERRHIKLALYGLLIAWSVYFDVERFRHHEDCSDFWIDLSKVESQINRLMSDFGFRFENRDIFESYLKRLDSISSDDESCLDYDYDEDLPF